MLILGSNNTNKTTGGREMRVFEHFNQTAGDVCPVCKTNKNVETVLIPIPGTENGGIMEAKQMHKKCYDLMVEMDAD